MKEMRKQFEKISDDLDGALVRNSQAQRTKPQECKEASNDLTTMKRCFAHTSLDYVFEVTDIVRLFSMLMSHLSGLCI